MKRSIYFSLAALFTFLNCTHKDPQVEINQSDILEEICRIETSRHSDGGGDAIVFFGNPAMDRYAALAGDPQKLVGRLAQTTGVCRGALIQMLVEHHLDYLNAHGTDLLDAWSQQDLLFFANAVAARPIDQVTTYVLSLLEPRFPVDVRRRLLNQIRLIDQSQYQARFAELVHAYRDDPLLAHLVLQLNLDQLSECHLWLAEISGHSDEDLHRDVMLAWATSNRSDKRERISAFLAHSSAAVRVFAEDLLAQLERQEKLELKMQLEVAQPDRSADDESKRQWDQELVNAAYRLDIQAIQMALDHGASPNALDEAGNSVLVVLVNRFAMRGIFNRNEVRRPAFSSQREIQATAITAIEHVLSLGADPNRTTESGETPLYLAAMYQSLPVVRLLLQQGADPNIRNRAGFTPADIARTLEYEEIHALLR